MAIAFSCPSCGRGYRVKEELAGKAAKCGKCGNRMKVPQLPPPEPAPVTPIEGDLASWMDEELAAAPLVPRKPVASETTCPSCGAAQPQGATLCGSCGADVPAAAPVVATKPAVAKKNSSAKATKKPKRRIKFEFQLGHMGSLIRGSLLSLLFAMVGAAVWAVVAFFTGHEFGLIAWVLGGLAGVGMAIGHEDEDGTTAGIIAAFMSFFGIIAAKVMIIAIFLFAAVAAVVGAGVPDEFDPLELQRELVAGMIANEELQKQGIDPETATDGQYDAAIAKARNEVADLNEEQLKERFPITVEVNSEVDEPDAVEGADVAADMVPPEIEPVEEPGFVSLFFQTMFNPIDGLFILFAFFTAYKVGSGQMTD